MFNPQLATFVCVADCGSFSQAAEKLYLSSTAVMKQLNALERHLELKPLERTRRGTVLTPADIPHSRPHQYTNTVLRSGV